MYGAVPNNDNCATRTPENIAVLRLTLITIVAANFTSSAIFPFFPVIVQEKAGSDMTVGFIFASNPFATAMVAPFVPMISQKLGRLTVLCIGLVSAAISLTCFGYVDNFRYWFFLRGLQGISNALIDGPSMALLLAHSGDVAEDLGLVESAAGLSYVVGPAIGGAIFAYFGFRITFVVLASSYLLSLCVVPLVTYGLSSTMNTSATSSNNTTSLSSISNPFKQEPVMETVVEMKVVNSSTFLNEKVVSKEDGHPENNGNNIIGDRHNIPIVQVHPWNILIAEPAIWVASFVGVMVYMTANFYDTYLSGQLKNTLALEARGRGLIYVWPALSYAGFSLYLGGICRKIGARNVLLFGCIGHVVVLLICGPTMVLMDVATAMGYGKSNGREFAWGCVCLAMGMWGFCLAPLFQAGLPLMHGALRAKGELKSLSKVNEEGGNDVNKEEENRMQAIKTELIEDALSALQQSTGALGAVLGPILGGLALEFLPKRFDPGCDPSEVSHELGDDSHDENKECETGFAWATSILAIMYVLVSLAIMSLPNTVAVESNDEDKSTTMEVLNISPTIRRRRNSHDTSHQ